jgi:hypothetical protein
MDKKSFFRKAMMPKMLAVQKLKKIRKRAIWCQLIETRELLIVIKGIKIERATRVQFFCKENKCKKGH